MAKNKHLKTLGVSSEAIKYGPKYHNKWSDTAEEVHKYMYNGHKNCHCKRGNPLEMMK